MPASQRRLHLSTSLYIVLVYCYERALYFKSTFSPTGPCILTSNDVPHYERKYRGYIRCISDGNRNGFVLGFVFFCSRNYPTTLIFFFFTYIYILQVVLLDASFPLVGAVIVTYTLGMFVMLPSPVLASFKKHLGSSAQDTWSA